jgi:ABC-type thiamine transport system ATPase subunit
LITAAARELPRELSGGERERYFLQEQPVGALTSVYAEIHPWIALMLPHIGGSCD